MKFVSIDPPGTFCTLEALRDALRGQAGTTFLDVGCGAGAMSEVLLEHGFTGTGIDFSRAALDAAERRLKGAIEAGRYRLLATDVHALPLDFAPVDVLLCFMVMEHVEDDVAFAAKLASLVKPGGTVILAVPARMDRWSIEDETVGHFRRYEREGLDRTLRAGGLEPSRIRSIGVPTMNLLSGIGSALIRRSTETAKMSLSQREQTETSGIQNIPWKTTFPSFFRWVLNRRVLWPILVVQRWFYGSSLGLVLMATARRPPA